MEKKNGNDAISRLDDIKEPTAKDLEDEELIVLPEDLDLFWRQQEAP